MACVSGSSVAKKQTFFSLLSFPQDSVLSPYLSGEGGEDNGNGNGRYCAELSRTWSTSTSSSLMGGVDSVASMEAAKEKTVASSNFCNSCEVQFENTEEMRAHNKLDWHRCNLKRRLDGKPPISEDEFEEQMDDLSSISGTESESEPDLYEGNDQQEEEEEEKVAKKSGASSLALQASGSARALVCDEKGNTYLVWKMLLAIHAGAIHTSSLKGITTAIVLCHGGHFAGAVFQGNRVVIHKTFHRYIVRKKAGGRQSTRDSSGNAPKSAGASMRRYNEQQLLKDIQTLLASWDKELKQCSLILLYAPGIVNKSTFFAGPSPPFNKGDKRIYSIPFTTQRPTQNEIKRVLNLVFMAEQVEIPKEEEKHADNNTDIDPMNKCDADDGQEDDEDVPLADLMMRQQLHQQDMEKEAFQDLISAIKKSDIIAIKSIVTTTPSLINYVDYKQRNALHFAAECGSWRCIYDLLALGCDPTVRNTSSASPFEVAKDKQTREAFRRYRGDNLTQWDWNQAAVPMPLSDDAKAVKDEKEREKKKLAKQRQKERQKEKRLQEEEEQKKQMETEKQKAEERVMTEREMRAAAAERRLTALSSASASASLQCAHCKKSVTKDSAFQKFDFYYCSTACVQAHNNLNAKK